MRPCSSLKRTINFKSRQIKTPVSKHGVHGVWFPRSQCYAFSRSTHQQQLCCDKSTEMSHILRSMAAFNHRVLRNVATWWQIIQKKISWMPRITIKKSTQPGADIRTVLSGHQSRCLREYIYLFEWVYIFILHVHVHCCEMISFLWSGSD